MRFWMIEILMPKKVQSTPAPVNLRRRGLPKYVMVAIRDSSSFSEWVRTQLSLILVEWQKTLKIFCLQRNFRIVDNIPW